MQRKRGREREEEMRSSEALTLSLLVISPVRNGKNSS